MTDQDIVDLYESGFVGASYSAEAEQELDTTIRGFSGQVEARDAVDSYGLYGSGIGKLILAYRAAVEIYGDSCLPGGRQMRGSCVAWSTRNAALVSYCCDVLYGSGGVRAPAISQKGIDNGCFSTDAIYYWRGKDSDGWFCDAAANAALTKAGLVVRKNYPEIGLDLEGYDPATEGRYGRKPPPQDVADVLDDQLVKNITHVRNYEQARDLIANGYALSTCGSEAFSKRRSAPYGICERSSGTWYHAMAIVGGDFRSETMDREGPLFLIQNSWGDYLGSSHNKVYGTDITIPSGSFWARWDDISRRRIIAIGPSTGWPSKPLPDFGLTGII